MNIYAGLDKIEYILFSAEFMGDFYRAATNIIQGAAVPLISIQLVEPLAILVADKSIKKLIIIAQTIVAPFIIITAAYNFSFMQIDLSAVRAFAKHVAPHEIPNNLFCFPLCYIILELSHYIAHYSSHRVRVLWCFHSVHHTPSEMMLFVDKLHFPLFSYNAAVRWLVCLSVGVSYEAISLAWLIDGFWGWLIHINDRVVPSTAFKLANSVIMTPSHHRVHH